MRLLYSRGLSSIQNGRQKWKVKIEHAYKLCRVRFQTPSKCLGPRPCLILLSWKFLARVRVPGEQVCASLTQDRTWRVSTCLNFHTRITNFIYVKSQRLCEWMLSHRHSHAGGKPPPGCTGMGHNSERALITYTAKVLLSVKARVKQLGEVLLTGMGWSTSRVQALWSQICVHCVSDQMKKGL